jgi:hypothetical protein
MIVTMPPAVFATVRRFLIGSLAALAAVSATGAPSGNLMTAEAQQDAALMRPTGVTLIMSTSGGKYDGTYQLSQVSRIRGEQSAEMTPQGGQMFLVEFLNDGDSDIQSVSFNSAALVGGVHSGHGPSRQRRDGGVDRDGWYNPARSRRCP